METRLAQLGRLPVKDRERGRRGVSVGGSGGDRRDSGRQLRVGGSEDEPLAGQAAEQRWLDSGQAQQGCGTSGVALKGRVGSG